MDPHVRENVRRSLPYTPVESKYRKFEVDEEEYEKFKEVGYKESKEKGSKTKEDKRPKIATTVIKKMIRDMQVNELQPLQILGSKVMGNLFDRVKFLRDRISETEAEMRERKKLNEIFNQEIEKDIEDMEKTTCSISDFEILREFKLNLSLLRMEKRKENASFWRDIIALRTQLQELNEQYQSETKISDIFSNLNKGE